MAEEGHDLSEALEILSCSSNHKRKVTIYAFGRAYKIGRQSLARAPVLEKMLSGPWLESQSSTIKIDFEDADSNITQSAFEIVLKAGFETGAILAQVTQQHEHLIALFALSNWLGMQGLVDQFTRSMMEGQDHNLIAPMFRFNSGNYYGTIASLIPTRAKTMLCRYGWKMPISSWDGIASDLVRDMVSNDAFYVKDEWERWLLAARLLNRRLAIKGPSYGTTKVKTFESRSAIRLAIARQDSYEGVYLDSDITPLLELLDYGIHYTNMATGRLAEVRVTQDVFNHYLLPDTIVSNALQRQESLYRRIDKTDDEEIVLGLWRYGLFTGLLPFRQPIEALFPIPKKDGCMKILDRESSAPFPASPPSLITTLRPELDNDTAYTNVPPLRFSIEVSKDELTSSLTDLRFRSRLKPDPMKQSPDAGICSEQYLYAGSFWHVRLLTLARRGCLPELYVYLQRSTTADVLNYVTQTGPKLYSRKGPCRDDRYKMRLYTRVFISSCGGRRFQCTERQPMQRWLNDREWYHNYDACGSGLGLIDVQGPSLVEFPFDNVVSEQLLTSESTAATEHYEKLQIMVVLGLI